MGILNLDKTRQDRAIKEYQKNCDELFAKVCFETMHLGWSMQQVKHFINKVMPELLSYELERVMLSQKVDDILGDVIKKVGGGLK